MFPVPPKSLNELYAVLELKNDADNDAIKKAYRRLAMIHHPDKNKNSEVSTKKFKEITEAYEILQNEEERQKYVKIDYPKKMQQYQTALDQYQRNNPSPEDDLARKAINALNELEAARRAEAAARARARQEYEREFKQQDDPKPSSEDIKFHSGLMLRNLREALKPDEDQGHIGNMEKRIPKPGERYLGVAENTLHGDRFISPEAMATGRGLVELRKRLNGFYRNVQSYTADQIYQLLVDIYASYTADTDKKIVFVVFKKIKPKIDSGIFTQVCAKYLFEKINAYANDLGFFKFLVENSKPAFQTASPTIDINKKDEQGLTVLAHALKLKDKDSVYAITDVVCKSVDFNSELGVQFPEISIRRNVFNKIYNKDMAHLNLDEAYDSLIYVYSIRENLNLAVHFLELIYASNPEFYSQLCIKILEQYVFRNGIINHQLFTKALIDRLSEKEINQIGFLGKNILCLAVDGCSRDFIHYLVKEKKVKTDFVIARGDYEGYTPLLLAAEAATDTFVHHAQAKQPSFFALVALGQQRDEKSDHPVCNLEINHPIPRGKTRALHLLAKSYFSNGMSAVLKIAKIDVNLPDDTGHTAFTIAVKNKRVDNIKLLLKFPGIYLKESQQEKELSDEIQNEILKHRVLVDLIAGKITYISLARLISAFRSKQEFQTCLNEMRASYVSYGKDNPEGFQHAEFFLNACFNPEQAFTGKFDLADKPFYQATANFLAKPKMGEEKPKAEERYYHFSTSYLLAYLQFLTDSVKAEFKKQQYEAAKSDPILPRNSIWFTFHRPAAEKRYYETAEKFVQTVDAELEKLKIR